MEELPAQTSYDVGLEAERAALDKQTQDTHQEQVMAHSGSRIQIILQLSVQEGNLTNYSKKKNKCESRKHQV